MKKPTFSITEIVKSTDYLAQLQIACDLSYERRRETGFLTHAMPDFSKIHVNKAILFGKNRVRLTDPQADGTGFKGEEYCQSVILTHFHTKGSVALPSYGDLVALHEDRAENRTLANIVHAPYYVNPVCVIGLYAGKNKMRVFFVQEQVKFIQEQKMMAKLSKVHNMMHPDLPIRWHETVVFGNLLMPSITEEAFDFFKATGTHQISLIRINRGKISDSDLEQLVIFDRSLFQNKPLDIDPYEKW